MKKFAFAETRELPFNGGLFYRIYKNAEFLRYNTNVETILSKGYQLRQALKEVAPGEMVTMQGMWLTNSRDIPLLVIKSGPNVIIKNNQFTANRLTGLTAAFAFDNRLDYPNLVASEALALGIQWDCTDSLTSRLYLSTVSGTEHFYSQFSFWPLVCALKKLQLKKITLEPVIKMAKIKNSKGIQLSQDMMSHFSTANNLWSQLKVSKIDLRKELRSLPQELRQLFG